MSYFKGSGKMDRKTDMVCIFMDKILQFITRAIGKMIWKMVKDDSYLKMDNILDIGAMTKNMAKENFGSNSLIEISYMKVNGKMMS